MKNILIVLILSMSVGFGAERILIYNSVFTFDKNFVGGFDFDESKGEQALLQEFKNICKKQKRRVGEKISLYFEYSNSDDVLGSCHYDDKKVEACFDIFCW